MKHSIFTRYASLVLAVALTAGALPGFALADTPAAGSGAAVQSEICEQAPQSEAQIVQSEAAEEPKTEQDSAPAPAASEEAALGAQESTPVPEQPEMEKPGEASVQNIIVPTDPVSYTCTMQFYVGETMVNEQILSEGETPLEPPSPAEQNAVFEGWFDENGSECDFSAAVGKLGENEIVRYTARMRRSYTVYYFSQPGGGAVLYTQTYESPSETVRWQEVAFLAPEGKALAGWSLTPNGEAEEAPALTSEPLCLYPVLINACWITPKGQGGAAPNPVYAAPGQPAPEIEPAVRQGYRFTGWFLNEECTESYTPGQPVEKDLTLYAGWEAQRVVYRVAYWQQNPDDDGYSLAEVRQYTALADSRVQPDPDTELYKNFTRRQRPAAQTVAGDGSTVIPVYYDRKIYTVKFYRANGEPIDSLTITARYGANIADQWPSRVSGEWPNRWRISRNGSEYQTGIVTMPAPNDANNPNAFYYVAESGRYTHELRYYLETAEGGKWELGHTDSFKSDTIGWLIGDNDLYEIKGFTLNKEKSPHDGDRETKLGDGIYGFEIYYDRNKYEIQFYSAGELDKTLTVPYGAPLKDKSYTPKHPNDPDLVFAGWYTNNLGQGEPFDFSAAMPAGSFALYAVWKEPEYRVEFDLAGGTAPDGADLETQTVVRGETAKEPEKEPVREGWQFLGWKNGDGLFNFLTPIRQNTTLTALWASDKSYRLSYAPGMGTGQTFREENSFGEGALVQLAEPGENWQPPAGSTGFLGWSLAETGSALLQPGQGFAMPGEDTVLYAVWGAARTAELIYDYNGGKDEDGLSEKSVSILQPNGEYAVEDLRIEREGYMFAGWSREKAGGERLQAGQTIRVNTLRGENNRLYAQWERAVITEVRLVVGGNMGESGRNFAFTADLPENGQVNFTLRHGGSYEFDPQPESAPLIAVQQENISADGYAVSVSEETQNGRRIITYRNIRSVTVPTGVYADTLPAALALALGGGILGAALCLRRKRL